MLTLERAKELLNITTTEEPLFLHAKNVMATMEGLARHFGEDSEHWKAIGYLHDYDYEQHSEEHLQYTEGPLKEAGLDDAEVRAILAHGYGIINDMEVSSFMKKFKDKKFTAKCDRELIKRGCEMLGMEIKEVTTICIEAVKPYSDELQLGAKA